ncbi:MAG: hypothetical protein IKC41_02240, partial [Clostridia bacterium]|nr:hypothetical protein [Clostridia bacterium]
MNGFKLTQRAQVAIRFSQETALEMGSGVVGTEHLLLGLVKEGSGIAAKVLASKGVTLESFKNVIGKFSGSGGLASRVD